MPKIPDQGPLGVAVRKICDEAVASFKVAPGDKKLFLIRKLEELKAMAGGYLTSAAVHEFERQVSDMVPLVNSEPIRQPIPADVPPEFATWNPDAPLPRPDWSMWCQRLEAPFLDAVALSCDIDPGALRSGRGVKVELLKEYFRRDDITKDRIRCGELAVIGRPLGVNPVVNHVRLVDFARMAIGLGWSLPDEFPRPPAPLPQSSPPPPPPPPATPLAPPDKPGVAAGTHPTAGVTISLPHTTDELEALFGIIRANWTTYDERNLPKQGGIAHEIDLALNLTPQSETKPSRFAEKFAALIKPHKVRDLDQRAKRKKTE